MNNIFIVLFKIGLALLIAGKLTQVTYHYAIRMAREQQSGLISLGQLSRELERSDRHR
jgi:hypothetical protein